MNEFVNSMEIIKKELLNLSFVKACYYKKTEPYAYTFYIEHDGGESVIASVIGMYKPPGILLKGDTGGYCAMFGGMVAHYSWVRLA